MVCDAGYPRPQTISRLTPTQDRGTHRTPAFTAGVFHFRKAISMVEFTVTAMRHYCRNPRCRSKLPTPVSNPREAFCTKGCRERFYRLRCYVCDEKKPGRLDAHTCGRRKCKNAMRTLKSPSATGRVEIGVGESIESTSASRSNPVEHGASSPAR